MTYFQLKCLMHWLSCMGVVSFKHLAYLKKEFDLDTNEKLLNFANKCFVYGIMFEEKTR